MPGVGVPAWCPGRAPGGKALPRPQDPHSARTLRALDPVGGRL
ncbi:hypothetical protein RMHFA_03991 [Roseomonas mucosa]|nr:hypothetical protein RMHFA_03991 [Roseomonas mucosa]